MLIISTAYQYVCFSRFVVHNHYRRFSRIRGFPYGFFLKVQLIEVYFESSRNFREGIINLLPLVSISFERGSIKRRIKVLIECSRFVFLINFAPRPFTVIGNFKGSSPFLLLVVFCLKFPFRISHNRKSLLR